MFESLCCTAMKHVMLEEITGLNSRLDRINSLYRLFLLLPPYESCNKEPSPYSEKKVLSDSGIVGFLFKESHTVVLPERVRPEVEWPADNPWVQTLIVSQEEGQRLCEGELSWEHRSCHPTAGISDLMATFLPASQSGIQVAHGHRAGKFRSERLDTIRLENL